MTDTKNGTERVVNAVREKYAEIARGRASSCCSTSCCGDGTSSAGRLGYTAGELERVAPAAGDSLGCGAPIAHLDPRPGEVVVDLGSGAGLDAMLSALKVGSGGRVIGVDMTPEMIERARSNAREARFDNVEFREGRLEALPVDDASVDAVTSNCVINLVPDKTAVFAEVARVLKPGGRLVVSDIVLDGELPQAIRADVLSYVGCVSGAELREDYFARVRGAGLTEIDTISDIDFLDSAGGKLPEDVVALLDRTGTAIDDVRGKVRSVTYRAVKPL